jgi:hypothetical protein
MAQIENLILANHAETKDGLLYLMGGGWTDHARTVAPGQPLPTSHLGIAVTVLVGWTETNHPYQVNVVIEPEDGGQPLFALQAEIIAGRHPEAVEGSDTRAVLAVSGEVVFPQQGGYRVRASLGEQIRTVSFRVRDTAVSPGALPPGQAA